jgi:uncharacterized protein YndB with AHSA1/START domain
LSEVHVDKDIERRRLTITAQFDASVERVWELWADPRLLERWWGPPSHPITVLAHDLRPGGRVSYVAVGPDNDQIPGSWDVREVDPPHHLAFDLGNVATQPVATTVSIRAHDTGTRLIIAATFSSVEAMDLLLGLGFDLGMRTAIEQLGTLLL